MNLDIRNAEERNVEDFIPFPNKDGFTNAISKHSKVVRKRLAEPVYREFFRKKFQVPSTHYDPRIYSYCELLSALSSGTPLQTSDGAIIQNIQGSGAYNQGKTFHVSSDKEEVNVTVDDDFNYYGLNIAHGQLSRYNYPTYFLDEQTLRMLERSKITDSVSMNEIEFPLPSMLISFPKGAVKLEKLGSDLATISITKAYEWKPNGSQGWHQDKHVNEALSDEGGSWSSLEKRAYDKINRSRAMGKIVPSINIVAVFSDMEQTVLRYPINDAAIKDLLDTYNSKLRVDEKTAVEYEEYGKDMIAERDCSEYLSLLALKILLFMEAKKEEFCKKESKIKEARYRRGKLMNEAVWGANFIGRSYGENLTEQGYGEERIGRTQRYHWRGAHFRGQWYGKGRTKYKTIFVQPYIVNQDDDNEV